MSPTGPSPSLYAEVVGQEAAVAELHAAAARPVHAYLFRGASGNGAMAAALAFAASLLCTEGGCGSCATCRAALDGRGSDLHVVRRTGATLLMADVLELVALAQRRPLEAERQVIIVTDVHLSGRVAPALLKTLEEPAGDTVFILLADELSPELATVASRCVQIAFPPVPRPVMVRWLTERGVPEDLAAVVADSSGGNPSRARLMVDDPEVGARAALWSSLPDRLNGTGAVAAALARQLVESTDRATEPLRAEHARIIERLTEEAKAMGERSLPGRKELLEHQQREERRWRTDALRAGLGALARAYRTRVVTMVGAPAGHGGPGAGDMHARAAAEAVGLITEAAVTLPRNPNEMLLLQTLLVRLGALAA